MVRSMFVSYVLRVRPQSVAEGRLVGEIEAVATGQRYAVRSLDQLMAFVLETVRDEQVLAQAARSGQQDES